MNLREQILKEHSKSNCNKIVRWIGNNQQRFDELFYLFLNDEYRVVQRAAWPLSYAVIADPKLVQKHFGKLLNNLQKPGVHSAVKRNTVRLLQDIPIPKRYQGKLMDICFRYINDPKEAIAVKACSLSVLENLSASYPEIIPEIKLLVEDHLPHETPAFKARARKFLEL